MAPWLLSLILLLGALAFLTAILQEFVELSWRSALQMAICLYGVAMFIQWAYAVGEVR